MRQLYELFNDWLIYNQGACALVVAQADDAMQMSQ